MSTQTTVTLTAETLPLFASKAVRNSETVEIEADSPDANSYSVTRSYMGYVQWRATDLSAAEAVEACDEWGLSGWTAQ